MNRVILVGRITRDPELRTSPNGTSFVSFTIAVNRTYTSQNGEREADFINCIAFNKQAENLNRFIKKGGLLGIDGRLRTRSYNATDGSRRYATEVMADSVQFLESKGSGNRDQNSGFYDYSSYTNDMDQSPRPAQNVAPSKAEQANPYDDISSQYNIADDDLPF